MTEEEWDGLAGVLADMPDVVGVLLVDHRRGRRGHCRVCTRQGLTYLAHPCNLRRLADQAAHILAARCGGERRVA